MVSAFPNMLRILVLVYWKFSTVPCTLTTKTLKLFKKSLSIDNGTSFMLLGTNTISFVNVRFKTCEPHLTNTESLSDSLRVSPCIRVWINGFLRINI